MISVDINKWYSVIRRLRTTVVETKYTSVINDNNNIYNIWSLVPDIILYSDDFQLLMLLLLQIVRTNPEAVYYRGRLDQKWPTCRGTAIVVTCLTPLPRDNQSEISHTEILVLILYFYTASKLTTRSVSLWGRTFIFDCPHNIITISTHTRNILFYFLYTFYYNSTYDVSIININNSHYTTSLFEKNVTAPNLVDDQNM